ncbi:MAG TPA: hypothetical protein VGI39_32590 [Polyangiaceae bacterium]
MRDRPDHPNAPRRLAAHAGGTTKRGYDLRAPRRGMNGFAHILLDTRYFTSRERAAGATS